MPVGSLGVGNRAVKTCSFVPLSVTLSQLPLQQIHIHSLKWTKIDKFNSDDHYIYSCEQEPLRRNGITLTVNKSPRCSTWVQSQKWQNDLSLFPRQTIQITVIQVYVPTTNAEEAEAKWFYEDLQDLLELTPKKNVLLITGDWNAKLGNEEIPGVTGKFGLGVKNEAG